MLKTNKEVYAVSVLNEDEEKEFVKTKIKDYETIEIGKKNNKISCIIFKSPIDKMWFCAVDCGAIVCYRKNKTELLKVIKKYIKTANNDTLYDLFKQGKKNCEKAKMEEQGVFFERF